MPKPVREFTKAVDALPEQDGEDWVLGFNDVTIEAGAAAMYRAWQSTDDELRHTWEEVNGDLKATFRRQFRTGLAGAIRDTGQTLEEVFREE
jgi:hypothetical protein